MKLEIDIPGQGLYRIESYTNGTICINGEHLISSVIVSPRLLINTWPPKTFTDRKSTRLNSSHIQKSRMPSSA